MSADAREDAIDHADVSRPGRHEATNLGHQDDQRDLTQIGALARHVGTRQQHDAGVGPKAGFIGDELPGRQALLHYWMSTFNNFQRVGFVDRGPVVLVGARGLGERPDYVKQRDGSS